MSRYVEQSVLQNRNGAGGTRVSSCRTCGALVEERAKDRHDRWHNEVAEPDDTDMTAAEFRAAFARGVTTRDECEHGRYRDTCGWCM